MCEQTSPLRRSMRLGGFRTRPSRCWTRFVVSYGVFLAGSGLRFQAYIAEAYVRSFAYLRNTKMAVRWWKHVRRQPRFQGTTLIQLLLAIWHSEHVAEAREVAVALLPAMDSLGPRVRARVVGALRLYMIQVLRARP